MNDDLISRKTLLKQFTVSDSGRRIPEYDIDGFPVTISVKDVKDIIRKAPPAFDKGNVLEELKHRRDWYDINEEPKKPRDMQEVCDIRERKGKWLAYNEAVDIIRKAGLNERDIIPCKADR